MTFPHLLGIFEHVLGRLGLDVELSLEIRARNDSGYPSRVRRELDHPQSTPTRITPEPPTGALSLGLRAGDLHDEVLGAWLAKESVRDVYLADSWADARVLLDKAITGSLADNVEEIVSLGKTLRSWRREILAHHTTGASNGPTEGLNLCVEKVKRCGHGFRTFEHYRLQVLLHAGGVTWTQRPSPPHIRTRSPQPNA